MAIIMLGGKFTATHCNGSLLSL